jgi:2',3'-cyclic-nucleotide 2'-phosphodiesterase (5'-nucleotidase family)
LSYLRNTLAIVSSSPSQTSDEELPLDSIHLSAPHCLSAWRRPAPRTISALALACALLVGACAGAPSPAKAPAAVPAPAANSGFTLLQINDTYKIEGLRAGAEGGFSRVRTVRREIEAEGRPVLVLHAGDFLFPSVMSKYLKGVPMIDALNLLDGAEGFDERLFVVPGNHEFDNADSQILFDRIAQSKFTWLSSNVQLGTGADPALRPISQRFPNVKDHVVLELGGIRVGIFGLTLADQRRPWLEYGFEPEQRRATIDRVLDDLEGEGAEFVIGLTHQEIGDDEWLAREFAGRIDWIAGGHEHVAQFVEVGGTTITKADADAMTAYRIDVRPAAGSAPTPSPSDTARRALGKATLLKLDKSVQLDSDMVRQVTVSLVRLATAIEEKTGRKLLDVVATSEHLLEGTEPAIRGRETALGDLLCDMLRDRLQTDLAFVNGGAIRVNDDVAPGGNVRVYELEGIFYYDDKPVVFDLTGRELLDLLAKSVSQATLGHGRFLQIAGIRFRYHVAADGTTRVLPADVTVRPAGAAGFVPLELDRRYRAASLDYTWRNGYRDGYPLFSLGAGDGGTSPVLVAEPEASWRQITEEALAALPGRRITTDVDGRIVRLEEAKP